MTYMDKALTLAQKTLGSVSPNPAVGSIVVKDNTVVGQGWTQPPGQAHAEVMSLHQAGDRAKGATLYTTLEPCNHFGRTPPCTEAIIGAGISQVCVAMIDPNPLVNQHGISRLRDAGIKLELGECKDTAAKLIEAYTKYITTGYPFVTAKFAMSLDGKIATRSGDSKWISSKASRAYVHKLRSQSDAVMVGINTVVIDNPRLTARDQFGNPLKNQPVRIILDSKGKISPGASLLSQPGRTMIITSTSARRQSTKEIHADFKTVSGEDDHVDLVKLMQILGENDITSILVETGGILLGSLFDLRLVDKVIAFISPTIIGGKNAPSPVMGKGVSNMTNALRLEHPRTKAFGQDIAIIGYRGA